MLVSTDGRVAITDFGIASALGESEVERDVKSPISGTPAYMAPEQVRGYGRIDTRADLYALGVMLFQMLTGRLPFSGQTAMAVALARLYEPPVDPRTHRPELSAGLAELVLRCLMLNPAERVQSAQELTSALCAELPPGSELLTLDLNLDGVARPARVPTINLDGLDSMIESVSLDGGTSCATAEALPLPLPDAVEPQRLPLAVLLFRGVGAGVDEYLVHGLTEELIDRLSESERLSVTGFGVVRSLPPGAREPGLIGRQLLVKVLLDGSLRLTELGMQAVVRILDVDSRLQFAVRRFERADRNILALAAQITQAVSELLTVKLDEESTGLAEDPLTVELYLKARHQFHRMSPGSARASTELFERALARRPDEPVLLTGYAQALTRSWFFSGESGVERAIEVAERACRAAPRTPEPHLALASIRLSEMQFLEAVQSIRRALAVDARNAGAHEAVGLILGETGPVDAALRHLNLALLIDKSVPHVRLTIARCHMLSGRSEEAFQLVNLEGCEPAFRTILLIVYVRLLCWQKDQTRAAALLRDPLLESLDNPFLRREVEFVLGDHSIPLAEYIPPFLLRPGASPRRKLFRAQLEIEYLCGRGDYEPALGVLRGAVADGLIDLLWTEHCPLLAPLRDHPDYATLRDQVMERALAIRRALGISSTET